MRRSPRGSITRATAALAGAAFVAALTAAPAVGADPAGDRVKVIVQFQDPPGRAERSLIREAGGTVKHTYTLIDGVAAEVPAKAIPGLRHNPRVVSVDLDATVSAVEPVLQAQATGDFEYDNAWGVVHIGTQGRPRRRDQGRRHQGRGHRHAASTTSTTSRPRTSRPSSTRSSSATTRAATTSSTRSTPGQRAAGRQRPRHACRGHPRGREERLPRRRRRAAGRPVRAQDPRRERARASSPTSILALQWAVDNDIDVVNMSLGTQVENRRAGDGRRERRRRRGC